jgi:two-component system, cell cycle sensor histidine kinase and response regulator CckA
MCGGTEKPVSQGYNQGGAKPMDPSGTILLVDDETPVLESGREMLSHFGFTILTAENGEAAIEVFRREMDRIRLVILDMNMPGMDGLQCLRQMMALDPDVKVVVASGYASSRDVADMLRAGACEFIAKPFRFRDVIRRINEIIG